MKTVNQKITFVLLFTFMSGLLAKAQDLIIKKNGEEINSKISSIDSNEIKYKKADNPDGPSYILFTSEVFMIKYSNGTKMIVSPMDVPPAPVRKKEVANEKKFFKELKSFVSFGYGFGAFVGFGSSSWLYGNPDNFEYVNGSPTGPFYLKYEYGVTEDLGIGINLAYLEYTFDDPNYYYYPFSYYPYSTIRKYRYTSFSGLLRANWHFGNSDKIDPYFGLGLGYRTGNWKYIGNDPLISDPNTSIDFPLGFETTFGVRILFSKHLGAYAEAGLAKSAVQLGLTIK